MLKINEFDKFFTKIDGLTIYTLLPRTEEAYFSLQSHFCDLSSITSLQVIIKENSIEDIFFLTSTSDGRTASFSARGTLPTTLYLSLVRALRPLVS